MGVPRGQERQAPQEVPEPRLSQPPVPRALPRRGRCSSGRAAPASPGSPPAPSPRSRPGSGGVGAAQWAGHGGRGEACGLPAALCGSPSVHHRLPLSLLQARLAGFPWEGAERRKVPKGLEVGRVCRWVPAAPRADLEPCYRLSGLGPRCLGALWPWKITCIPGAVGFHPVRWGQKPWDWLALLLRLRNTEAVRAVRHSSLLLLLCFEIALPKKWNSMSVSPLAFVEELEKRVLVISGIEVKLRCVIL